ncbi:hypothetical protein SDC9_177621 [bioreactor metagenome]|uniref:Uncharacterized protein n=1 Tax=bioreactor metagenome TaxID=1076179 RepID=A0A645H2U7_9ZZZZ
MQCVGALARIAEPHVLKLHPRPRGRQRRLRGALLHRGHKVKNFVHPGGTGRRAGKNDHQICQHDQRQQNLVHITHQRHHFALCQAPGIDLHAAKPHNGQNGGVGHHKGQRAQQRADLPHPHADVAVFLVRLRKPAALGILV